MANDLMSLRAPVGKSADAELMAGFAAQRMFASLRAQNTTLH